MWWCTPIFLFSSGQARWEPSAQWTAADRSCRACRHGLVCYKLMRPRQKRRARRPKDLGCDTRRSQGAHTWQAPAVRTAARPHTGHGEPRGPWSWDQHLDTARPTRWVGASLVPAPCRPTNATTWHVARYALDGAEVWMLSKQGPCAWLRNTLCLLGSVMTGCDSQAPRGAPRELETNREHALKGRSFDPWRQRPSLP